MNNFTITIQGWQESGRLIKTQNILLNELKIISLLVIAIAKLLKNLLFFILNRRKKERLDFKYFLKKII